MTYVDPESYVTHPPARTIAAAASRWLRALRISHPIPAPIISTTIIIPRTLKRRSIRQGRETGFGVVGHTGLMRRTGRCHFLEISKCARKRFEGASID